MCAYGDAPLDCRGRARAMKAKQDSGHQHGRHLLLVHVHPRAHVSGTVLAACSSGIVELGQRDTVVPDARSNTLPPFASAHRTELHACAQVSYMRATSVA
jgi:hypothetical protein